MSRVMTLAVEIKFDDLHCGACDLRFLVPDYWLENMRKTGDTWYCPNGHPRCFRDSDNKRLQAEVEALKSKLTHAQDQRLAAEKDAQQARAEAQRQGKRVANGVCPCCNRTFVNLGRHMKGQHPDYATGDKRVEVKR